MKMSWHRSLEKYTSHFIWKGSKGLLKVLLCERWVGGWTELQHCDPHSYDHNSIYFLFSWAAQPGAWVPRLSGTCSHPSFFSSTDLNFLSLGLYNNLTPTLLPESVTISHSIQPLDSRVYILIFLYFHRCISYFDSLARSEVNIQLRYVTYGFVLASLALSWMKGRRVNARISLLLTGYWPNEICFFY